jgi:hypothetical protein
VFPAAARTKMRARARWALSLVPKSKLAGAPRRPSEEAPWHVWQFAARKARPKFS